MLAVGTERARAGTMTVLAAEGTMPVTTARTAPRLRLAPFHHRLTARLPSTGNPHQVGIARAHHRAFRAHPGPLGHPAHRAPLIVRDQGDDDTRGAGPRGTSRAMQIVLVVGGRVDV